MSRVLILGPLHPIVYGHQHCFRKGLEHLLIIRNVLSQQPLFIIGTSTRRAGRTRLGRWYLFYEKQISERNYDFVRVFSVHASKRTI